MAITPLQFIPFFTISSDNNRLNIQWPQQPVTRERLLEKYELPSDATDETVAQTIEAKEKQKLLSRLGLSEDATKEEISEANIGYIARELYELRQDLPDDNFRLSIKAMEETRAMFKRFILHGPRTRVYEVDGYGKDLYLAGIRKYFEISDDVPLTEEELLGLAVEKIQNRLIEKLFRNIFKVQSTSLEDSNVTR